MPFHTHTLPNGLHSSARRARRPGRRRSGSSSAPAPATRRAEVAGVSHFLEHMVFKGTPRRTAFDVNLDFDRIGANYNAYTSEENTVYYAAVLPEYLPQAVDILADILRPSLRQRGLRHREAGDPRRDRDVRGPAGVGGLGPRPPHLLRRPPARQQRPRHDRQHQRPDPRPDARATSPAATPPPNIIVAAAGNFDWTDVRAARRGAVRPLAPDAGRPRDHVREARGKGGVHVLTQEKVQQEHVMFMSRRPAGRLAAAVRRRHAGAGRRATTPAAGCTGRWSTRGWRSRPTCSYYENEGSGCGVTYLVLLRPGPDGGRTSAIVRKVLADVQRDGITAEELRQAKSKIASRVVRGSERPMGRMQAIASAWTYSGEYRGRGRRAGELRRGDRWRRSASSSTATRSTAARSSPSGR